MMRLFLFGCSATLLMLTPAWAQTRDFPYEGLVESNDAYARSGPGKQFYPTGQLPKGTRVTVHRHDPGGWYMIAPPPKSFSWIRAEYVRKTDSNKGIITENNVVVRVGSAFGDETRDVEQIRLDKNDQVEILAEKTLSTSDGSVPHFKIAPPAGEYRWISGKYITPVNQIADPTGSETPKTQQPLAAEEPKKSLSQNSPPERQNSPVFEESIQKPDDLGVRRRGPDPQVLASQKERLDELDGQFRHMVNGRTGDWKFTALEQGYRQLQEEAALPALASQIDLRFNAIDRYRKIKKEYDDLMKLTEEARKRDAQLMSSQQKPTEPEPAPTPAEDESLEPEPEPNPEPTPELERDPATQPQPAPDPREDPGMSLQPEPAPAQPPQSSPQQNRSTQPVPRFDGAGIVQRAAAAGSGTPAYVLVTPQGRVLAYLQALPGLNLESYVGKSMGIHGQRSYRPELRTDLIVVRSLTPVRLAP